MRMAYGPNDSVRQEEVRAMRVAAQVPSLDGATGWINSGPISAASLRRRVVLVNFGTSTLPLW
jgi:hypothetical protein